MVGTRPQEEGLSDKGCMTHRAGLPAVALPYMGRSVVGRAILAIDGTSVEKPTLEPTAPLIAGA